MFELQEELEAFVGASFQTDTSSRIIGHGPRFHLLRATEFVVARVHADVPDDVAARLLAKAASPRDRPREWPEDYADYIALLGGQPTAVRAGPLYRGIPGQTYSKAGVTLITSSNRELLHGGLDEWIPDAEAGTPMVIVVEGGRAVAVCASVVHSPSVHVAGVETLPGFRGLGFGARAVAGWIDLVSFIGLAFSS